MKNLRLILSTLFLVFTFHAAHAGQYNSIINIGDSLPDFKNLPSIEGSNLSSSDLTESVLVLVSLANHCPWVQGMDPDLVELANQFKDQDVRFIGLSFNHREDDQLPAMKEHAKKNGYTFSYLYDESQQLGRKLGATRTPEYFVFDKDRKLVYTGLLYNSPAKKDSDGIKHINGEPSEFYVHDAIAATLAGKPVKVAETRAHGCTVKYVN
ncbi:MAG: thioredoxin family protein [Gammaproteobacteria bacterium]|nr:thioredoxin family protein [Gammaproteobacteria bacterium]